MFKKNLDPWKVSKEVYKEQLHVINCLPPRERSEHFGYRTYRETPVIAGGIQKRILTISGTQTKVLLASNFSCLPEIQKELYLDAIEFNRSRVIFALIENQALTDEVKDLIFASNNYWHIFHLMKEIETVPEEIISRYMHPSKDFKWKRLLLENVNLPSVIIDEICDYDDFEYENYLINSEDGLRFYKASPYEKLNNLSEKSKQRIISKVGLEVLKHSVSLTAAEQIEAMKKFGAFKYTDSCKLKPEAVNWVMDEDKEVSSEDKIINPYSLLWASTSIFTREQLVKLFEKNPEKFAKKIADSLDEQTPKDLVEKAFQLSDTETKFYFYCNPFFPLTGVEEFIKEANFASVSLDEILQERRNALEDY